MTWEPTATSGIIDIHVLLALCPYQWYALPPGPGG